MIERQRVETGGFYVLKALISVCCEGECCVWYTLCPCDRCGRGDESPEGSTASRAYQRAAYHTPEREREGERQIRTGTHTEEVRSHIKDLHTK